VYVCMYVCVYFHAFLQTRTYPHTDMGSNASDIVTSAYI
jgi:hypothetical protein